MSFPTILRGCACAGLMLAGAAMTASPAAAHGPYTTYYHPTVSYYAPAPVVTYYHAPTVVYHPVSRVVTRYRPVFRSRVTRIRPAGYVPVVYP